MFQDFLMESLQHGLIVTDTVTYRAVGILHVQHRPQGLVHHVDDIKGTGIAVQVDISFPCICLSPRLYSCSSWLLYSSVLQASNGLRCFCGHLCTFPPTRYRMSIGPLATHRVVAQAT